MDRLLTGCLLLALLSGCREIRAENGARMVHVEREIAAAGATSLQLEVLVGAAKLEMFSHDGGPLVKLEIDYSGDREPQIDYQVQDGRGTLKVSNNQQEEGAGFSILGRHREDPLRDRWMLSLSRSLPIDIRVEFGLGSGRADFGGLELNSLSFATGLSDVELMFSEPCKGQLRHAELATGLGSMEVRGLSNARIGKLEFAGGLGSALLDFSGRYRQETPAELDVGMGSLLLRVPEDMGVKIRHSDSFLSNHEFDRLKRTSSDTWFSENWREGPGNLSVQLSVGMGSVRLEWIAP
jgi:hypothetical protein